MAVTNTCNQTITQYNVQTGSATNTLNQVAPGATTGVPLISQGASAQPIFGTVLEAGGGTAQTTYTKGDILYASATNTLSKLAIGSNTNVLTLAAGVPTWAAPAAGSTISVVTQVFTSTGTYTPTANMKYCVVECIGSGGGGGGTTTTGAGAVSAGGGGGGGGYARKTVSAATIGASQAVTVGNGGTGGAVGGGTGGTGGTVSLGAIVSATGGLGGVGDTAQTGIQGQLGGAGGLGASGDFNSTGGAGSPSYSSHTAVNYAMSGCGGNSYLCGAAEAIILTSGQSAGNAGQIYGGGGSGAVCGASGTQSAGGVGGKGIVIVTEYIM